MSDEFRDWTDAELEDEIARCIATGDQRLADPSVSDDEKLRWKFLLERSRPPVRHEGGAP